MDPLRHDLRSALRTLVRRPVYAALIVLTLALGLGASTAMFSVVDGVLLEPLPYDEPERLVLIERVKLGAGGETDVLQADNIMSPPDLRDVRSQAESLDAVAGYGTTRATLVEHGEPQPLDVGLADSGLLEVFGLSPHLGRDLRGDDALEGAPPVVLLSHDLWTARFDGDPSVLGRSLELTSGAVTVVGVAPAGFAFPEPVDVWLPWQIDEGCGRSCHMVASIARLAEGHDVDSSSRELETLSLVLATEHPETNTDKRFRTAGLHASEVALVRSALWILLGAVQLVLAIGAVNVANLVLVRGARRRRELAIRAALGAGRLRLFRQLMLESGLLALAGAVVGLGVGQLLLTAFLRLAPADLPRLEAVGLDAGAIGFTAGLSLVVLMIFGLMPSLQMARVDLRDRGRIGSVDGRRSRQVLLAAEVALALVLLLGAGLLLRSFVELTRVELGFEAESVTKFSLALPEAEYPDPEDRVLFAEQLEARLESAPGVASAGVSFSGPFGSSFISSIVRPLDRPEPEPGAELIAMVDVATPGFFEALEIRPLRGRLFGPEDVLDSRRSLIVNRSFAEEYFPTKEILGERVTVGVSFGIDHADDPLTVVGVVPDVRYSLSDAPGPAVYLAQSQSASPYLTGFVRTERSLDVAPIVRETLRGLDPLLLPRSLETQDAAIDASFGSPRFYLVLLSGFAAVALLLAAVGLYGVVAYLVSQRTRELAVRMALGADRGDVLRLVLGDALKPALIGIGLGLLAAVGGVRLLESLLYGVDAHDLATFVAAPALLLTVALAASLAPAVRAARLQPTAALGEG